MCDLVDDLPPNPTILRLPILPSCAADRSPCPSTPRRDMLIAAPELYRVSERRMGQILDAKKFILNNYVERVFEK